MPGGDVASVDGGALDSDRIGPYSLWQGALDAKIMVVGQDFADVAGFQKHHGWPGERVATNLQLVELLGCAGIQVDPPQRGTHADRIFLTNAVLCLKTGGMSAPIPAACFRACGERFLRPLVELIQPRAVVTLGLGALDALLLAFGQRRSGSLTRLLDDERTFELPSGARVFPMMHPGPTATRCSRSLGRQREDWTRLGAWLRAISSAQ